jgi:hypothetical protein
MFSENFSKKMMDRFFRKVDDCLWDLMTGKIGIKTSSGDIATLEGEGDDAQVVVNPFSEFGIALPAFAQNTSIDQIKKGDLIYSSKKVMGWVVSVPDIASGGKAFKLLRTDGTRGEWRPPKVQSLGLDMSGAMVLRSLLNTVPGGDLGGLQGTLLPMMMMGGEMDDMESILPLMLMGQNGALGGNNMLQTIMMMKMLGGKKGTSGKTNVNSFFNS